MNDLAYAEAAGKEALGIITEKPDLPPWWGPDVLMTLGDVLAREGRLREAKKVSRRVDLRSTPVRRFGANCHGVARDRSSLRRRQTL